MTSLEHESNDTTSVSASDYGNDIASDYGNDGWDVAGDMDVCLQLTNSISIDNSQNKQKSNHTQQTSQDPSSPLAVIPSSTIPLSSSALAAQRNSDIRDEWSWNDWGSLEEQPVREEVHSILSNLLFFLFSIEYAKMIIVAFPERRRTR